MARFKPVTDDEIVRAIVRIEDVRDQALELVRRMNGKQAPAYSPPELPVDRAASVMAASGALIELATVLLQAPWIDETKGTAP
jgi:hypothetical protein